MLFSHQAVGLWGPFCMQLVNAPRRDETRCQLTLCSLWDVKKNTERFGERNFHKVDIIKLTIFQDWDRINRAIICAKIIPPGHNSPPPGRGVQ